MVTPFRADGTINFDVAIELATYLVAEGYDGLVVAGSTGEGSSLSDKEKLELFACVAGAVEVPVLAGSTFADTARSVELTRQVLETGVTGVLATTPAYARPSQKGIAAHFAAIAASTELPIMLYDVPSRTGRKIAASTTIDLVSSYSNIVAIKDATGNLVRGSELVAKLGGRVTLLSGDDGTTFPLYSIGARGVISVVSNVCPREMSEMWDAVKAGNWERARQLHYKLRVLSQLLFAEPSPAPTKAALALLGRCRAEVRLPLVAASDAIVEQLRSELRAIGVA